ncbi:MAG: protein kinase [Myxococcota bacterium]
MEPSRIEAVPQLIGGYPVDGILGRGSTATVYRVHDPGLDRPMALKLLLGDLDQDGRDRFELEARALSRVNHPHVVQVFTTGSHEGRAFITQELVEGCALSEILDAKGKMRPSAVVELGLQLAAGLGTAAAAGVLHRDVKPENVLVRDDGVAKLTDFGIARLLDMPRRLTEDGTTVGTPHYMSPEQGQGAELDARSDQYSLGATLYHLLTGAPPFHADNVLALLLKHLQSPVPPLEERCPECPPRLASIVERMLAKDPSARFPSFEALEEALASVEERPEEPLPAPPPPPIEARSVAPRTFRATLREESPLIAAGMTLAAAVILSVANLSPRPAASPLIIERVERGGLAPAVPIFSPAPTPEATPAPAPLASKKAARARPVDPGLAPLATPALLELAAHGKEDQALAALALIAERGDVTSVDPLTVIAETAASASVRAAAKQARDRIFKIEE